MAKCRDFIGWCSSDSEESSLPDLFPMGPLDRGWRCWRGLATRSRGRDGPHSIANVPLIPRR